MKTKQETQDKIISCINKNPALTREEISILTGRSRTTVQRHLQELIEKGMVIPGFFVTPKFAEKRTTFWIFIETRYNKPEDNKSGDNKPGKVQKEIVNYQVALCDEIVKVLNEKDSHYSGRITYVDIQILLGADFDIVLKLISNDMECVADFITQFLRTRDAIARTRTAWSVSLKQYYKIYQDATNKETTTKTGVGESTPSSDVLQEKE